MKIIIKYFASIRESMGRSEELYETSANDLQALRLELIAIGSPYSESLAIGKAIRVALNQELVGASALIKTNDEIAFFPPVTGG
ncbi:MAG: MoaD/ThiS family protein [Burkholderiaceae bacterium]|jgi:molybdopterin synthase sulfur carrier subunit